MRDVKLPVFGVAFHMQNHRQKVFNRGGAWHWKID